MSAVVKYFQELVERCASSWNRFWFVPIDPIGLCVLRILTGLLAFCFVLSFTSDLDTWFGGNGLLPMETVQQLTAELDQGWNARASLLFLTDDLVLMWVIHVAGLLIIAAFTLGLATRITNVLSLVVVLSYIHRAPMITGQFEPVLTLLLFYLCIAPCGRNLSLDRWLLRKRRAPVDQPSLAAGISLRLIQVHIALLYLMMGLNMLGGGDSWWLGQSVWWLLAHSESRLVDWTFLARHEYLISFWTQGIVVLELTFGTLIWNRLARPLLLAVATVHWLLLGLVTGMLLFAAAMLVAQLAFISPETVARYVGWKPVAAE